MKKLIIALGIIIVLLSSCATGKHMRVSSFEYYEPLNRKPHKIAHAKWHWSLGSHDYFSSGNYN